MCVRISNEKNKTECGEKTNRSPCNRCNCIFVHSRCDAIVKRCVDTHHQLQSNRRHKKVDAVHETINEYCIIIGGSLLLLLSGCNFVRVLFLLWLRRRTTTKCRDRTKLNVIKGAEKLPSRCAFSISRCRYSICSILFHRRRVILDSCNIKKLNGRVD